MTRAERQALQPEGRAPETRGDEGVRRLGARLRNLRKMSDLSLEDVATNVGLSTSFLSLVERGESDLSMSRFTRLAQFYGVQPSELLVEEGSYEPPDVFKVTETKTIDRGKGVEYYLIRDMHPQLVFVVMQPRSVFEDLRSHAGDDVWIVCDGAVDLLYGERSYPMKAGETARFHGGVPHGISNPHKKPAQLVALFTVPYW